ncbi:MAG: MogA/MoaB family molybdenum cofactor biosynthesis protein [Candidatus Stahlbacteria bacterium]|nr:MogA/MoaB family molybdenum cofactor biosynthesis protein [Candidatus Stahlbacteria bacterium]
MKVGVITISDGAEIGVYKINPDELEMIRLELVRMADEMELHSIITTGGTGLSDRDVTPEATLSVIEKNVPGISEIMRVEGFKITPHAILSRGVCGIRKKSLIINLPGSTKAVEQGLKVILPCLTHAVEIMKGTAISHEPHK